MMADARLSGYRLVQAPARTIGSKASHAALLSFLLVSHTAIHYASWLPWIGTVVDNLPFFNLHVLHEAEYLGVIAYAAWIFRLRGGLVALGFTTVASVPFLFVSRNPQNAVIEVLVVLAIGGFIVFIQDRWARERDASAEAARRLAKALADLQAAERQLVQKERLSALGTMASSVAHDFQNLLTPIYGFSELLLTMPPSEALNPEARRYAERIHLAAGDASRIVTRLRAFYRPLNGGASLEPVDLNTVIREAIALADLRRRTVEAARHVSIAVSCQEGIVPSLNGHPTELREALTNLLLNAFDALPNGGHVLLRTWMEGKRAMVEVGDSGVGMPDDVLQRCFEPFFTTKGEQGTGLGLAIVHGAVTRHGGEVRVDSEVGRGTTFTLTFPLP